MKIIGELTQNTPEWHQFRSEGIGASESNIIMGKSKFMTAKQLWEQKVFGKRSEEKNGNFITDKGHRLESKARPLFEMEMMADFPDTIAIHDEFPIFRASLDGYNLGLNACWECKFVGQDDFEKVKNGEVLEQYYPQLQHQLMVTGAKVNYLYVIADDKEQKDTSFPYKTAYIEVRPDDKYISEQLLPELKSFWTHVIEKTEPSLMDNDVIDFSDDAEMASLLERYNAQKLINDSSKEEMDSLSKDIFKKIGKAKRASCKGIKITQSKSEDKTKLDYEAFCNDNDFQYHEKYFKTVKGRITKRITFPKS